MAAPINVEAPRWDNHTVTYVFDMESFVSTLNPSLFNRLYEGLGCHEANFKV